MGRYPLGDAPEQVAGTNAERLFYTTARAAQIETWRATDPTLYNFFIGQLEHYLGVDPYGAGELAAAFGIGYLITGSTLYRNRGHDVFQRTFNVEGVTGGWANYTGRNAFRADCTFACMYFSYLGDTLDTTTKTQILDNFEIWADYWMSWINADSNFEPYMTNIGDDSDEHVSLAGNLTVLGTVLAQNGRAKGTETLAAADNFSSQVMFGRYLDDMFAGGQWGEGTAYSWGTMYHVAHQLLVNKEQRGINYAESYIDNMILSCTYNTLPGHTTLNYFDDVQAATTDYINLRGDAGRYTECMAQLRMATTDTDSIDLAQYWLNTNATVHGASEEYSGIWSLLGQDPTNAGRSPATVGLDTAWYSEGTKYWACRSDWTNDATALWFNANSRFIDHKHQDTLHYNLTRKGKYVTKYSVGYGEDAVDGTVDSWDTICHNTLIIENADSEHGMTGGSLPTNRPFGQSVMMYRYNSATLGYAAADAKNGYNSSGFYGTEYANLVARQIALIKPNLLVVYDHTITDPNATTDVDFYLGNDGSPYTREVELVQHFHVSPTLTGGYYHAADDGQEIAFKPLLPASPDVTTVDESVAWASTPTNVITAFQRRYHLRVKAATAAAENEFLTVMALGDTGLVTKPVSETTFAVGSDALGVLLDYNGEWHCLVFPKDPNTALTSVAFDINATVGSDTVNYYVTGLAEVSHTISAVNGVVSVTQGAGTTATDNVLEF